MDANDNKMMRDYIIEALKKIQEINEKVHTLYQHNVDILDLENGVPLLEKSIAVVLRKKEDQKFRYIQDIVGWWLYENVEKVVWYDEDDKIDLSDIEVFVNYLINEYSSEDSTL